MLYNSCLPGCFPLPRLSFAKKIWAPDWLRIYLQLNSCGNKIESHMRRDVNLILFQREFVANLF